MDRPAIRLGDVFAAARREERAALFAYIVAGDGGFDASLASMRAALCAGVDSLIVAVACRLPVFAPGALYDSYIRAAEGGATFQTAIGMVKTLQAEGFAAPFVLSIYASTVFKLTVPKIAADSRAARVDSIAITGCPTDRSSELTPQLNRHNVRRMRILDPKARITRSFRISGEGADLSSLFVMAGADGIESRIAEIRAVTSLPLIAETGVETPADAARAARFADGVVVWKPLCEALAGPPADAPAKIAASIAEFRKNISKKSGAVSEPPPKVP